MDGDLHDNPELKPFVLSNVSPTGTNIGVGAYSNVTICGAAKAICSMIPDDDLSRALTQFLKECQLMSTLRHPNVVQFLGVCFFEGSRLPALVIEELLTSLHDLLDPQTQPPTGKSLSLSFFKLGLKCSVLHNVASGLAYLHGRTPPIIHHNLSAKNVLLTSELVAKLADLGVARIVPRLREQVYMPPEVTNEKWINDASTDVFSFGVLTIFTVGETFPCDPLTPNYTNNMTGKLDARTELQRRSSYADDVKKQLRASKQVIEDHPLIRLIQQCLDNTPAIRPNISEVLSMLEEARAGVRDEESERNRVELVRALQNQPRNQVRDWVYTIQYCRYLPPPCTITVITFSYLVQNLACATEVAELKQQLTIKEDELAETEETIRKGQKQIKQHVSL